MFINCLLVGMGGAIGALMRYSISLYVPFTSPVPTLIANLIGSFILGLATILLQRKKVSKRQLLFIGTGFCGGLTTLSTLSKETVELFQQYAPLAFLYVLLSAIIGLCAVLAGMKVGQWNSSRSGEQ